MMDKRKDILDQLRFYQLALELWDLFWEDSEMLIKDIRGREIARQLTKSVYSISANIEEGVGRGFGKEYSHFLRISRGSTRETKGGYWKARKLLPMETVEDRREKCNAIIGMINATLNTLENKRNKKN